MTRMTRFLLPTAFVALLAMSVPAQGHGWSFGFSFGWGPRYYYGPRAVVYGGGYGPAYYRSRVFVGGHGWYGGRGWYGGHGGYAHYNYRPAYRGGHFRGHHR